MFPVAKPRRPVKPKVLRLSFEIISQLRGTLPLRSRWRKPTALCAPAHSARGPGGQDLCRLWCDADAGARAGGMAAPWGDAGDHGRTELHRASQLLTSWAHSQATKGTGSTVTGGDLARGSSERCPTSSKPRQPQLQKRSPRRVPPGAVASSSGRFFTETLAGPACSLPPLQQLLSCTFTSSSKGFFQNVALSRRNNKTTTLIFLAETSTKRVTQKTFLKFFFSLLFFSAGPLIFL